MATNVYNGHPAGTEVVKAGTTLYRILPTNADFDANSFYDPNPPLPLGHPDQGRFNPVDRNVGGYLYVAQSMAGAIAEGVLRGQAINATKVHRVWLTGPASGGGKTLATMRLNEDVEVASLYGAATARLNLSASLLVGADYDATRTVGTEVFSSTPTARGLKYRCANHDDLKSLMLVARGSPPSITITESVDIWEDDATRTAVLQLLHDEFKLSYHGVVAGRNFSSAKRS